MCPRGHYCNTGSSIGKPCPVGTFSNFSGLKSHRQCVPCTPGMYCSVSGLTTPLGLCLPGHYCTEGSLEPNPSLQQFGSFCPRGHYCPQGSAVPIACPIGTFSNLTHGTKLSDCLKCTSGRYCDEPGLEIPYKPCESGFYCIGGASSPTPKDGIAGNVCPPGYFCPTGASAPYECSEGTYANSSGLSSCPEYPSGYYCVSGTIQLLYCPPGFYCESGTGIDITPCPVSTFNPYGGMHSISQCVSCFAGMYCAFVNATDVTGLCAEGYFCPQGSDTPNPVTSVCPIGHFCLEGASLPVTCPSGTYQDNIGQATCLKCPAGYYCLSNSSTFLNTPCPPGYYCPAGTTYSYEYPCPSGRYNPSNGSSELSDCLLCPPRCIVVLKVQFLQVDSVQQDTTVLSDPLLQLLFLFMIIIPLIIPLM